MISPQRTWLAELNSPRLDLPALVKERGLLSQIVCQEVILFWHSSLVNSSLATSAFNEVECFLKNVKDGNEEAKESGNASSYLASMQR